MALKDGEAGEKPAAAGGGLKKIIVLALLLALIGGAGAAGYFFLAGGESGETQEAQPELGEVEYLELSPAFVINFPSGGQQRFLQANLTVMSRDPEALAAVTEHMPVIRHNLINLLSAQALQLARNTPVDIEGLRALATEEIQQVLLTELGRTGIEEVLFTSFVMQ